MSRAGSRQHKEGVKWNPRQWHFLYFVSIGLAILLFIIAFMISQVDPTPFSLIYLSSGVSIAAFVITALASKRISSKGTAPGSVFESLKQDIEEWNPDESPAVMLGASGVYGIVYGLGVTDALGIMQVSSIRLLYH